MAKKKVMTIEERLEKLGLGVNLIKVFLSSVHENYWNEAVKIYENVDIIRNSLENEDSSYVLLRDGDKSYDVNLEIVDEKMEYFCNCSHRDSEKCCAHVGAVLLRKLLRDEVNYFNSKLEVGNTSKDAVLEDSKNGLNYFRDLFPVADPEEKKNMIYFNFEDFDLDSQILKIQKGIIRKDGTYGAPLKFFGKNFNFMKWDISRNVRQVLSYIYDGDNFEMGYSQNGFSKNKFYDVSTDLMMPVLRDLSSGESEVILGATFSRDKFKIIWDIKRNKNMKYVVEPVFVAGKKKKRLLNMNLIEIGNTAVWVFDADERCFYGYDLCDNLDIVRSVIRFPKKLELDEFELKEFFSKYYQKILDSFEFTITSDLKRESRVVSPVVNLYMEKSGITAKLKLKFNYLGSEIDYFSNSKDVVIVEEDIIYDIPRDMEEEDRIVEALNECSVVTHEKKNEFMIDCDLVDFVVSSIPKITELGVNVLGEDKLFNFKVIRNKPRMDMKISESNDWFNLRGSVKFGREEVSMEKVVSAIFNSKRFIELSDGKRAIIPKKWVDSLSPYVGFIDFSGDGLRLSKNHVMIASNIADLSDKVDMGVEVSKVFNSFKNFDKILEVKIPKGINAELRPYQKAGFDWLNFLRDYGFNGILADDMGLGKTLQTLTLLQKIKLEKKKGKFLVVVPTSLVFNWKAEVDKFVSDMSIYLHHGPNRVKSKKKFAEMFESKDLIITTYGVIRNDLDLFLDCEFEYIALDEAHIIKNPMSVTAKSVYALRGKSKLVISGTPVQNNLTELWSLFHFLNPGYLGGYEFFKDNFVSEIEKNKNEVVADSLRKLINPFLLRRTKKVISDELPEKSEMVLRSSFTSDERVVYESWRDYYRSEIRASVKEKGVSGSRMKILEGLMKLRQVCLHPRMVDSRYVGSSAKFDLLMMELEKVLSEGHKVLVFSSFVKMLSIVKEEFDKKGLSYSYLDGKTKNREKVVSDFQNSEDSRAFLISIKAGGVGLNLTSADYVFILDPWWNPAVEMQAMDRAHRIGQSKKVFVYKMIAEDSIEEKILKLQKSKKKLVENLIVEDEGLLKNIDVKDIKEIFG